MALCVATLIASEFMPVSLLTPIAADLGVTEGQTGQAISISGIFAVLTSLFVAQLTRHIDRRHVVLAFSALLVVSGSLVAFAPNYAWLMLAALSWVSPLAASGACRHPSSCGLFRPRMCHAGWRC